MKRTLLSQISKKYSLLNDFVHFYIISEKINHTGISGNDQAYEAARSTINLTTEKKFKIPHTDFKMKITKYIQKQRQQRWNYNKK